jgi:hypothetical protein
MNCIVVTDVKKEIPWENYLSLISAFLDNDYPVYTLPSRDSNSNVNL